MSTIDYKLHRSSRAKRMSINISGKGDVLVTVPLFVPSVFIEKFVNKNTDWIKKHLLKVKNTHNSSDARIRINTQAQYDAYKNEAMKLCTDLAKELSKSLDVQYNRISIKNHKRRWGSCSSKKNLNFNYKIVFLTSEQARYLVAHELSHLKEMNHSKKFWTLVESVVPNYKELRKEMRYLL